MEPANGFPGKVPERPERQEHSEPREQLDPTKPPAPRDLAPQPPLPEPPQEDAVVRVLRKVPMYAFIVFLGVVAADFVFPGVKVVVQNAGPGTMSSVTIGVKNETHSLEPIPEGKEGGVRFRLLGDASVTVTYIDDTGKTRIVDGGEHRFSRMSGSIVVRVRNGKADAEEKP